MSPTEVARRLCRITLNVVCVVLGDLVATVDIAVKLHQQGRIEEAGRGKGDITDCQAMNN